MEFTIKCVPLESEAGQKYIQQSQEAGDVLPILVDDQGNKFIPIPGEMFEPIKK